MCHLLGHLVTQCEDIQELIVRVNVGHLSRYFVDSAIDVAFHVELTVFLDIFHQRVVVLEHGGDVLSTKQEMLAGDQARHMDSTEARSVFAAIHDGTSLPQPLKVCGIVIADVDAVRGEMDGVEIVRDLARSRFVGNQDCY